MSLLEGMRATVIWQEFELGPKDEDFWPVWEQIIAFENDWA